MTRNASQCEPNRAMLAPMGRGLIMTMLMAGLWLALSAASAAAQPTVAAFDAVAASAEITNDLARRDLDAAAFAAVKLMEATTVEKLKDSFHLVLGLGPGQYADLIYSQDYGKTEKDIIFKIDFDKSFLFVRYLFHVDRGGWRLIHIHLKTEDEEPFPKDWVHIYPK
jgi:hypothetical protein